VVIASEAGRHKVLAAILHPLDRTLGNDRADDRQDVAWVDRHLVAEAAAHVRADDLDLVLGKTGNQRVNRAVCVWGLSGRPEDQLAGDRVHMCHRATGLHGRRVNAGVQDLLRDDDICTGKCCVSGSLVAGFPLFVNDVVSLALFIVTNDGCVWLQCLLCIGHNREWFVINVDELESIASDVPRLSNDKGDFLALETNLVRGQNCLGVVGQGWHPSQTQALEVFTGNNGHDTGKLECS